MNKKKDNMEVKRGKKGGKRGEKKRKEFDQTWDLNTLSFSDHSATCSNNVYNWCCAICCTKSMKQICVTGVGISGDRGPSPHF